MIRKMRKPILRVIPIAIAFAGCIAFTVGSGSTRELTLTSAFGPKHPVERFMLLPWRREVASRSGGSLTINHRLNPDLVPLYKNAAEGAFDFSSGLPGYTSELFPRTLILELPGIAETGEEAVDKFWDAFPLIEPEWKRVKLLALWTSHSNFLMFRGEPVRKIVDLKGRKIRVPSKTKGDMVKALGMTPVFMPITRVSESLRSGAITGVLTTPSAVRTYKLNEVITSYLETLPLGRMTFFLAMNRIAFERLTAKHKAIIEETTGRKLSKKFTRFFARSGKGGVSVLRRSTTISALKLSLEEQSKAAAVLEKVRTDWIAEYEKRGIPARQIVEAMGVGN